MDNYQNNKHYSLHATDRIRVKEKIPFYKKKVFHLTYICSLLLLIFFIFKEVFKEPPPNNVIDKIGYYRNNIQIHLKPESVKQKPEYNFGKLADNKYFLDIYNSTVRYKFETPYSYGCMKNIERVPVGSDTLRLIFTFRTLKDTAEIEYIDKDACFELTFNKYMNDKYFVVIDPGHGGEHTGAVGRAGTKEKRLTLDIVLRLKKYLDKQEDIIAVLTRDSDETIRISERKRISNFWNADLFLSIHTNSSRNRSVNQTEIYYYDHQSRPAAQIIRDNLTEVLKNGRGIIRRVPYGILYRNYARNSVLIEAMYLSNRTGEKMLKNQKYLDIIAENIYKSVLEIKGSILLN